MNVYGYANQSPMIYVDPNGENPLLAAMLLAGAGAVLFDWALATWQGECYTIWDAAQSFAIGAALGGAGFGWKGVKAAGKEFSHFAPSRWLNNSGLGKWLNKRSNPYRSLNGNYVTPYTHAMTDYYRRIKDVPASQMWGAWRRYPARVPAWMWGAPVGAAAGQMTGCECGVMNDAP
jgi:hypothetical protein